VRLTKYHGLGNDFLVALDEGNDAPVVVDAALARRLCDRHRGIGADGLIHGARPVPPAAHNDAATEDALELDVVMHLFNADGSRAELSGNGIRCLAQAVVDARWPDAATDPGPFTIAAGTDTGVRTLEVQRTDEPTEVQVRVAMGAARPGPALPASVSELLAERHATVDMGNPHLVVLVDDPTVIDLAHRGGWLEEQFEHGANVEFIAVTAPDQLMLAVWERGAGITQACGTGAAAAAHVARGWGLTGNHVVVRMPGGDAEVHLDGDDITLVGPSVRIAEVIVDD
jgi:diaminopimelate epimerase